MDLRESIDLSAAVAADSGFFELEKKETNADSSVLLKLLA